MKITIDQSELIVAVKQYIKNQGMKFDVDNSEISFTASRGAAGILTYIETLKYTPPKSE